MNWIKKKLIDISNPKQWKNLPGSEMSDKGYLVYGANGIIGKYPEYNHEFPTLVITCRGATCGSLHITQPKSYINSNAMALDDLKENIDIRFLYYALNKRGFKDIISGSAQPQITREGLSKVVIKIPEKIEDQIRIANILSKAEALIAQRKESIKLLDEFLKSTFLDMFGDPVRNEQGWKKVDLKNLTTKISSGSTPLGGKEVYQKQGILFIRSQNIRMNFVDYSDIYCISDEIHNQMKRTWLKHEDVLLNITGASIGRVATYLGLNNDANVNQHVCIIRTIKEKLIPRFLEFLISNEHFQQVSIGSSSGGTREAFTFEKIKKFKIILPALDLQTQFTEIVEKTETLKTKYKQSLKELENLYGALSQMAFAGQLTT